MTQIDPMLARDKEKPLNQGFVCSKHKTGYIGKCPTCAYEERYKKDKHTYRQVKPK